ncbi:linear amide C-N hydrolase [Helicobacter sp. 13S00477-4]|uniref:linear amide C-N hydrolase n=1 Tax=Helicobacter sp. 13S00477-4 TaxID=1905759 RepID=UPI000BA550A1|nr:linear amide C-N hydrolase [Helicobacter sp. 13S00477-4]PAF52792.1 hypothetical protein BKH44_01005 [Helicobacter sp. 13S00477-4]
MCTAFSLQTKKGFISARSMESPTPGNYEHFNTLVLPKGFCIPNAQNQKIPNRYAILGSSHYGLYSLCDGINEHGLSGSVNLFPHLSSYPQNPSKNLSFTPQDLFPFLLGNVKNCNEAKEFLKDIEMLQIPFEGTQSVLALHIALFDKQGGFLVIEPQDKELKIYESKIRVMTNSPQFPWHIQNLSNYTHLQAEEKNNHDFEGINPYGWGSTSMGLPGDFTPTSRFIRAAFFVRNSPIFEDNLKGVKQALRILHQFDIPFGAMKKDKVFEITQYIAIMDNIELNYYLKHHDGLDLEVFGLKNYLDAKNPIVLKKMT